MVVNVVESGDADGREFEVFFADRFAPLARLAYLLTGSSSAADEIAQDACENVLKRWPAIDNPNAYARASVVNGARAWHRRRKLFERTVPEIPRDVEIDSDAIALRSLLLKLSHAEREVLVLRYFADLKIEEIAAEVDRPPGSVKSMIHRSLATLSKELM